MNRITQEARKCQAVVKLARRKGQSYASRMYGVSLFSVKRMKKHTAMKSDVSYEYAGADLVSALTI